LNLKSEDPEFSQIGVAVFFKSFDGTPLNTWDRHLYGARGAMISGSRIRDGLYRYILEADLAEKQTDRLGAIEFYESIARQHDPWLYERVMREPRVGRQWSMAPLGYRVSAVARDRLLLVGDAAGYLSPITGQGNEFALRTGRLAAAAAAEALHGGDLSAEAFASYVEGRRYEVERQVDYVRAQLRILRDPEALLRASREDNYRAEVFGPYGIPATERGSLR
jgi:flavin-dependent dehydrogenase